MSSESKCCEGWKTGDCCESDACNPATTTIGSKIETMYSSGNDDIWESDDENQEMNKKCGEEEEWNVSNIRINHLKTNTVDEEDTYTDPAKLNLSLETLETRSIRRKFNKSGYIDGKSQWQEYGLQSGFNDGFSIGASLGLQVGKLVAILQMEKMKNGDQIDFNFEKMVEEFEIGKFLSSEHFDFVNGDLMLKKQNNGRTENENSALYHPILEKWKTKAKQLLNES